VRSFSALTGDNNFKAIKFKAKKIHSQNFIMCARLSKSGAFCLGVITSRKLGNAVKRNKIRRRIKAALHDILRSFELPLDIVIIPRAIIFSKPYQEIEAELQNLVSSFYEKQ